MAFYLWMFPLLFVFHDMEEIIGLIPWIHLNETLLAQKAPTILKIHKGVTIEDLPSLFLRNSSLSYPLLS